MAVQKNKTSKQRKHTRAANWKISAPNLSECPNFGELKASHKVCPNCGAYCTTNAAKSFAIWLTQYPMLIANLIIQKSLSVTDVLLM